jgi:putative permease
MLKIINKWLKRYTSHPEAVALIVIMVASALALIFIGGIFISIILSSIIAYILNGGVKYLTLCKIPKLLAIFLIYFLFLSGFVSLIIFLFPILLQQLTAMLAETSKMLASTQKFINNLSMAHPELLSASQLNFIVSEITKYFSQFIKIILDISLSSIGNILTTTIYAILIPILVILFLKDGKQVINWLRRILPQPHNKLSEIGRILDVKIWAYISGKIIETIIVSVVTSLTLLFMGMDYPILLGVGVGISVIIPYVGAVLITIPILIIGFLQWGFNYYFGIVLVVYTLIMLLDAYLLVPVLFSGKMQLHPVAIILAILIFGSLLGFWGVFFAIPIATLLDTLIKHWPKAAEE